jgi:hypothetical protein
MNQSKIEILGMGNKMTQQNNVSGHITEEEYQKFVQSYCNSHTIRFIVPGKNNLKFLQDSLFLCGITNYVIEQDGECVKNYFFWKKYHPKYRCTVECNQKQCLALQEILLKHNWKIDSHAP